MAASSFQRKAGPRQTQIPGTVPSRYTYQRLASTGVPDLDALLGGGLPVGTLLLIEEDYSGNFSKLLLKYFLAEGLVHNNSLFISSLLHSPASLLQSLPRIEAPASHETTSSGLSGELLSASTGTKEDDLKIAWRYKNQQQQQPQSPTAAHSFNLLKTMSKERLDQCDVTLLPGEPGNPSPTLSARELLKAIYATCTDKNFMVQASAGGEAETPTRNLLRIGVASLLGGLTWDNGSEANIGSQQICTFLLALRSILRSSFCVAVVTIPHSLHHGDNALRERLRSCSDFSIHLESFESQEAVNPAYKDYHGILRVDKLASLGMISMPPFLFQDECELVFKSKRTRFQIEKFHLPPDLSETTSRDQIAAAKMTKTSCSNIDF